MIIYQNRAWSRLRHNVRRPGQIVFPDSDSVCPNGDKIYLTIVTFRFLLLINEKRDSFLPSGSWIVFFWLPAETLSQNDHVYDFGGNHARGGLHLLPGQQNK